MIRATAGLVCTILVGACSQIPGAGIGTTMQMRGYAFAPPAFNSFCAKESALCSTKGTKK